jgi:hypothetical protein
MLIARLLPIRLRAAPLLSALVAAVALGACSDDPPSGPDGGGGDSDILSSSQRADLSAKLAAALPQNFTWVTPATAPRIASAAVGGGLSARSLVSLSAASATAQAASGYRAIGVQLTLQNPKSLPNGALDFVGFIAFSGRPATELLFALSLQQVGRFWSLSTQGALLHYPGGRQGSPEVWRASTGTMFAKPAGTPGGACPHYGGRTDPPAIACELRGMDASLDMVAAPLPGTGASETQTVTMGTVTLPGVHVTVACDRQHC